MGPLIFFLGFPDRQSHSLLPGAGDHIGDMLTCGLRRTVQRFLNITQHKTDPFLLSGYAGLCICN